MASVVRGQPGNGLAANPCPAHVAPYPTCVPHPPSRHSAIPADFSKVDSILRHLQQTESPDWFGEVMHCSTQVSYLLLQNYNISRFNFYSYNLHLVVLTALFFGQRIWFFLWHLTRFSDEHGPRFACHSALALVLVDSIYCSVQLISKDFIVGGCCLAAPLLSNVLFYFVYLKRDMGDAETNTNVFTAELFGMLSRCVYHSLETAYCIGVLPVRFLQYEDVYFDISRCLVLTAFVAIHAFFSLLCLELHCLGSEVLQQTRMLGSWRLVPDLARLKSASPRPAEWSHHNCPYPRGAVVSCKGHYYEAVAMLNTCAPTSHPLCIWPIAFALVDFQRAKTIVLAALLILNGALVHLVLWSNHWSMYAVMLIPNCSHFLYVKYRRSHSFFNPAHLNLRQLQWDFNIKLPRSDKVNSMMGGPSGLSWNFHNCRSRGGYGDNMFEEEADTGHLDILADTAGGNGGGGHTMGDGFGKNVRFPRFLQSPNPVFISAVSASTLSFFGAPGTDESDPEGVDET